MTDVALAFSSDAFAADLAIVGGDLATDDGLRTAVIISLFTDARARDDDALPEVGGDKRGWWGDFDLDGGDQTGSRLWLLHRAKLLPSTALKARDMCREALDWLLRDGVAASVEVETQIVAPNALVISVAIARPSGPGRQRFDFVWNAMDGSTVSA